MSNEAQVNVKRANVLFMDGKLEEAFNMYRICAENGDGAADNSADLTAAETAAKAAEQRRDLLLIKADHIRKGTGHRLGAAVSTLVVSIGNSCSFRHFCFLPV